MADKKISQLNAATALQGTEKFPIVQSGETKHTTYSHIIDYYHATDLTVSSGDTVNLNDSSYDNTRLLKMDWSGASGNMVINLPDATESKNLSRVIRFVSCNTFETNTRARLTPAAGQTLDGSTNYYEINVAYEGLAIWCDGAEWFIIQKKA